jgi:hypothetical protein
MTLVAGSDVLQFLYDAIQNGALSRRRRRRPVWTPTPPDGTPTRADARRPLPRAEETAASGLPVTAARTYPAGPAVGRSGARGRGVDMRSIWRGAVSFGLVSIGVKLYSATEDKDVRFHQVHAADGGRVKYKRVCSIDGEEIEYGDIAKGYELPDGQLVILTDDDLAEMPLSTRREIEVLQFVDQSEIDPVHFEKTYYLEPDGPATRPTSCCATRWQHRPGGDHQDRAAAAGVAGRAARPRRRPGAAHHALARRDPPSRLRLPRRGRVGAPAGAADGRGADHLDGG